MVALKLPIRAITTAAMNKLDQAIVTLTPDYLYKWIMF